MWKIAIHFEFLHMHNFCKMLTIIKSNTWSVKKRYSYTFTKPYSYKFNARLNLVHIIQYLEQNLRHFRSWAADYQVTWRQSTCRRIYLIYWPHAVSLLFTDKIVWIKAVRLSTLNERNGLLSLFPDMLEAPHQYKYLLNKTDQ